MTRWLASSELWTTLGTVTLGFGTLAGAIAAMLAAVRSKGAHDAGKRVEQSIGPANGETLTDLMHRFLGYEEYQHTRNHDIAGQLSAVTAGIPALLDATTETNELLRAVLAALETRAGE